MAYCDYDLAILGSSLSGCRAACEANQRGARVALLAPNWLATEAMQSSWQMINNLPVPLSEGPTNSLQQERSELSLAALRLQGIDVITEAAEFQSDLTLTTANRSLKASRYLLTDGYSMSAPEGLNHIDNNLQDQIVYCHQLGQLASIPNQIAVIGDDSTAVEWAYALSRVATVTLISQSVFPTEDQDIQRLAIAQLKGLGINLVQTVERICTYPDGIRIETAHLSNEVNLIVVVPRPYDWRSVKLEQAGIASSRPIAVNRYLQTTCPHIYVSGGSLGGENRPELTHQETVVALENALFGRWHVMRYEQTSYSIQLLSPMGHWGLTESQARQRYGQDIHIIQGHCLPAVGNHVLQTNFCKLITSGARLLGLHVVGNGAPALIALLGREPTVYSLARWVTVSFKPGTLQDAVDQAIKQWQTRRWSEGQWRRDWAENWFNWRRSS